MSQGLGGVRGLGNREEIVAIVSGPRRIVYVFR